MCVDEENFHFQNFSSLVLLNVIVTSIRQYEMFQYRAQVYMLYVPYNTHICL